MSFALAAWIAFVCTPQRTIDDPLAAQLSQIRDRTRGDTFAAVDAIVGERGLFSSTWHADSAAVRWIAAHVDAIRRDGMRCALKNYRSRALEGE